MDPIVKYETNTPCINIGLNKIDIPHNIVEIGEISQRHPDSPHRLSIHHVDLVGAAILLQRQRFEHRLGLLQVLPTSSRIAVTSGANVNISGGGLDLDLIISDVTPISSQKIHRQNAALDVLVVGLVLAIDLHDGPSIAA